MLSNAEIASMQAALGQVLNDPAQIWRNLSTDDGLAAARAAGHK